MDPHSPEFQRAQTLDQIFKLVGSQSKGQSLLFAKAALHLRIEEKALGKLIGKHGNLFKIQTTGPLMANGKVASYIFLTHYGKEQYESGWTFTNQLEQDEIEKAQKKKKEQTKQLWALIPKGWNILLGATTILFAYLTWDATSENKLHNEKEERWEIEKRELQSQYETLNQKFLAIPDSLRQQSE